MYPLRKAAKVASRSIELNLFRVATANAQHAGRVVTAGGEAVGDRMARKSTSFVPSRGLCIDSHDNRKSEDLESQVNIGCILQKIVSTQVGDGSAPVERKNSHAWRFVFDSELAFKPKPDVSLSEWLIYVDKGPSPLEPRSAAIGSKEIVEILDANQDAQLDGITRNLSVLDVVHVLTDLKITKSAFMFYEWVKKSPFYIPDQSIYTAIIERLITSTDLDTWGSVQIIISDAIKQKIAVDGKQFGRLLALVEAGDPKSTARMLLYVTWLLKLRSLGVEPWFSTYEKVMKKCNKLEMYDCTISVFKAIPSNTYSWAFRLALSACRNTSNLVVAEEFLREMKSQNMKLDAKCFNDLLTLYANRGHADKAKNLLEEMKESGVLMDLRPYTCVIHAYGKVGRVKEAEDIFQSIEQKLDPGIYRAMAACYRNAGYFNELLLLLRQENGSLIGATCFASAFEACVEKCEWKIALEIMKDMQEWGMSPSPRLYPLILLACSKVNDYGACKVVDFNVREMDKLSMEELERIIRVYVSLGKIPCVLKALDLMDERGLGPATADLYEYCILNFSKTSLADAMVMYDRMRFAGHVPSSSVLSTLLEEHIRAEDILQSNRFST